MNDTQMLDIEEQNNDLGKVEISPEVIEVIAGIAASEVEGVASLRGNFATGVAEKLGRKNHGKGVKVDLADEGVSIDLSINIVYGVSVPEVAQHVQQNVKQTLETMTSVELSAVNIHVVGVQFESQEQSEAIEHV